MRRSQPYEAVASGRTGDAPVVGTAPTMLTRRVHGDDYNIGIEILGNKGNVTAIQHPFAGQGLISPNFPYYQPSSVAPDMIRTPLLLVFNRYSPVSHPQARYNFKSQIPVPATKPATMLPGVNSRSRRGGGNAYAFPDPFVTSSWPTPSQWLASQVRQGLTGGQ